MPVVFILVCILLLLVVLSGYHTWLWFSDFSVYESYIGRIEIWFIRFGVRVQESELIANSFR